jgi:hypothetical protein
MAKAAHDDAFHAGMTGFNMMGPMMSSMMAAVMDPEMARQACNRMMSQIKDMNQICYGSMNRSVEAGWDLATRLAQSADPYDAAIMMRNFMNERRDAILADARNMSSLMLKMSQSESEMMKNAASRASDVVAPMQRQAAAGE